MFCKSMEQNIRHMAPAAVAAYPYSFHEICIELRFKNNLEEEIAWRSIARSLWPAEIGISKDDSV